MPALAVRDANVPVQSTPRKDDKSLIANPKPQPKPHPPPADPLVAQRCLAFIASLPSKYAASISHSKLSHSNHPALPDLSPHLTALSSSSATLLQVGAAYEVAGHWLYNCDKHAQAVKILHNAATVYDACNATEKALLARIDMGRALNAAVLAVQQQQQQLDTAQHGQQTAAVEQAQQHWTVVQQQVQGKDLRLDSAACYQRGLLHAQLAAMRGQADVEQSTQLFDRALEVWSQLADLPDQYRPSTRAADSDQMIKHRQHVLLVEAAVQTAAQRSALYGQQQQQVARLQWLAELLSSALLYLPAAVCWLQCAVVAMSERDGNRARECLSQAELSRSQPAAVATNTLGRDKVAMYELRYAILHFQLSVLSHAPPSTPISIPPFLAAFLQQPVGSLPLHRQMLRAQLLSVLSHIELQRGRSGESESHCRQEYKVWSSCLTRLFASPKVTSQSVSADVSALITSQSQSTLLRCDHYSVLWWYIDCLYRYARLLERHGQPLLCLSHLSKATAVCEAVNEHKQRRRLDRLRWRVKIKLGWQPEQWRSGDGEITREACEKERWEVAADDAVHSLEAAMAQEAPHSGGDLLEQSQLSAELADGYVRRGELRAASDKYRDALTMVSQLVHQPWAASAMRQPETAAAVAAVIKRKQRTTAARLAKSQPKVEEQKEAEQVTDHIPLQQQATLEAKLASIALTTLTPPSCTTAHSSLDGAIATLLRSSSTLQQQQQQIELSWASYWQAVAQHKADALSCSSSSPSVWSLSSFPAFRPLSDAPSQLGSSCTTPCSSLLYSAAASSFTSSPPYVSRMLLSSLCSSLGLSSPLDAIFTLNASLGIATRHNTNRTLPLQPTKSTNDDISQQLSSLQLTDNNNGDELSSDQSVYALDDGLELDRERFDVEFIDRLPMEWSVVTMALSDDRRYLLVSRVQSTQLARAPVLLRLPLWSTLPPAATCLPASQPQPAAAAVPTTRVTRGRGKAAATAAKASSAAAVAPPAANTPVPAESTTERPAEPVSSSYCSVLSELCAVLDASGQVNSSSVRLQHKCTYKERETLWKEKYLLNDRMHCLVQRMEHDWFGPWKGALCGDERDDGQRQQLHDSVVRVAGGIQAVTGGPAAVNASSPLYAYVRVLLQSSTHIPSSQLHSAAAYLLGWTDCARESDACSAGNAVDTLAGGVEAAHGRVCDGRCGATTASSDGLSLVSAPLPLAGDITVVVRAATAAVRVDGDTGGPASHSPHILAATAPTAATTLIQPTSWRLHITLTHL